MSRFSSHFLAVVALLGALFGVSSAADQSPLNVLVITIDTLRADHLGCYGYQQIHTPNIDGLAARSARFERAYTPVPVTLPAHTAIFTGTYPMFSGMHDFSGNKLNPLQPTLASVLKQQGYVTGAVLGSAVLDSRFGLNHGFDFYYDHFDFSRLQEANLDEMERPGNLVADVALDWLKDNYRTKFFLWVHLYDPHAPYRPPAPFDKEYATHPYDGEIAFADVQVGRVLAFLNEKGLYDKTVIVLSGDHGESLGEHGEQTHGFFIYNATLHVPLLVHSPGSAPRVVTDIVSLVDVMPSILEAVKIPIPTQVQGHSMLPFIAGKHADDEARALYAESFLPRLHFNWSELRGAETRNYHFIDAPSPELYNLITDPGESHNLISEKKAVAQEMQGKLTGLIQQYSAEKEMAVKTGLDPSLMERLKSLGYAGFSGGGDLTAKRSDLADPKDRIHLYELISDAVAASQHGDYAASIEKLTASLKVEPGSIPVHYLLGLDNYRSREFTRAAEEFQYVLKASPDYALAAYYLGLARAREGKFDDAISALQRALQLDPSNSAAAFNLGATYLKKQMPVDSERAFRQALSIDPDYVQAHRALGEVLLYQGKTDDAVAELKHAVDLSPGDPSAHASLSRAYRAKGMAQDADREMQRAQELGAPK